jgi:hypothetical protein
MLAMTKKQRVDGMFPIYPLHGQYKTEESWRLEQYGLDDYIDGHLCAIINDCEDVLFTRDAAYGRRRLPILRRAMACATKRKFVKGLMHVGYGGAFIELWYAMRGTPSTTQIFYIRALMMMAELEKFLGHSDKAAEWASHIAPVKKALKRLITRGGFFVNAVDDKGRAHGDGTDYFESIPNVIAAPLEVASEAHARRIVAKIRTVPQLDQNTPICANYPGRTETFHPRVEWRGVGTHWNGGAWMGFGGFEVWTHLIARDYAKAARLINQLIEIRNEFGLQDFVAGFGAHQGANVFRRKPCDHPIHFQMGHAGNPLRGLLGVQPRYNGLLLMPRIFPDIKRIQLKKPVYYAGSEVYFTVRNGRRIARVTANGERVKPRNDESVLLSHDLLTSRHRCNVEILC